MTKTHYPLAKQNGLKQACLHNTYTVNIFFGLVLQSYSHNGPYLYDTIMKLRGPN